METEDCPDAPSLPWRAASTVVMGVTGLLTRGFLFGASRTEVHGLEGFLKLLDARQDVQGRQRGLITGMEFSRSSGVEDCQVTVFRSIKPHQCVRTYSPHSAVTSSSLYRHLTPFLALQDR